MRFFDFIKANDINRGLEEYRADPKAVLVDVRTLQEYSQGHIPESINVPLHSIPEDIGSYVKDKSAPLYVYCRSGARSSQAVGILSAMGYENARNIGGISAYRGEISA